jgi:hypothetical protein
MRAQSSNRSGLSDAATVIQQSSLFLPSRPHVVSSTSVDICNLQFINFRLKKLSSLSAPHATPSPYHVLRLSHLPPHTVSKRLLDPSLSDIIFLQVVLAVLPADFSVLLYRARLTSLTTRTLSSWWMAHPPCVHSCKHQGDAVFICNQVPVLSCPSFPSTIKTSTVRYL